MMTPGMTNIISQRAEIYAMCPKNNPTPDPPTPRCPQISPFRMSRDIPRDNWQINFTVMPRVPSNFRHFPVLVDTFSG